MATDKTSERAGRKEQTQLLLPPETVARINAVAIASGYVRAEVLRQMVEAQVLIWERRQADGLRRLGAAAERFGISVGKLAKAMAEDKLSLADVESRASYPGRILA